MIPSTFICNMFSVDVSVCVGRRVVGGVGGGGVLVFVFGVRVGSA